MEQPRGVRAVLPWLRRGAGQHLALPVAVLRQRRGCLPHPLRTDARPSGHPGLLPGADYRTVLGDGTAAYMVHVSNIHRYVDSISTFSVKKSWV